MSDYEFQMLGYIYESPNYTIIWYKLLNKFENEQCAADAVLSCLKDKEWVKQSIGSHFVSLTPQGINEYLSEKQRRDDNAKQAAKKDAEKADEIVQAKKDKKQQFRHDLFISLISTAFGSLITLFVEHFQEIVDAVFSSF